MAPLEEDEQIMSIDLNAELEIIKREIAKQFQKELRRAKEDILESVQAEIRRCLSAQPGRK